MAKRLITLSSWVSLSRLPFAVLTVVFLDTPWKFLFVALGVFSDAVDGWLARKLNQKTELGAFLDGLMDKVFFGIVFIALIVQFGLPWYLLALILARDIFVTLLFLVILAFGLRKDVQMQARWPGKLVTVLQAAVMTLLLFEEITYLNFWVIAVFAVSLVAMFDYMVRFLKDIKATTRLS